MAQNTQDSKKLGRNEVLSAEELRKRFLDLKRFLGDNWGRIGLKLQKARKPDDIRKALRLVPSVEWCIPFRDGGAKCLISDGSAEVGWLEVRRTREAFEEADRALNSLWLEYHDASRKSQEATDAVKAEISRFFGGTDGFNPEAALVQGTDGNFYGTTNGGGAYFCPPFGICGTIFKVTAGGKLSTLHSFSGTDGNYPNGLVLGTDGNFYGTTQEGGANTQACLINTYAVGCGTVFRITPGGVLTTMYSFAGTDGAYPRGLTQGTDGNFYGTTNGGGSGSNCGGGCGAIFKITPSGSLTTLYSFNLTDGALPFAGLMQASDGNFYGTTYAGGANNDGTVFKITAAGALTTLHSFDRTDGLEPEGGLVQATEGNFYGTTYWGGTSGACGTAGCGTVFTLSEGLNAFPRVTLSAKSLSFGNQVINTTSAAKSVTVANTGSATLDISSIMASANFAISSNTCGATLATGAKCKVSITFTPTKPGKQSGTLTFADNAPNSPQTVALLGTGVVPAALTPAKATYAAQTVGTTSPPKTFTLTNNQNVTLTDIGISTAGDFAVSATTCTTSLAVKGTCTISVTFTPTAAGKRTGKLSVSDSAGNSPQTSNLTGSGK